MVKDILHRVCVGLSNLAAFFNAACMGMHTRNGCRGSRVEVCWGLKIEWVTPLAHNVTVAYPMQVPVRTSMTPNPSWPLLIVMDMH